MLLGDGRLSYAPSYHVGGIYGIMVPWLDRGMEDTPGVMAVEALAIMPPGFLPAAVAKVRAPC